MKITYTTNKLQVQIESESTKDAFKQLAQFQEIFDQQECALCKKNDLQFVVRTVEGNDFYEIKCKSCYAKLDFGQYKSGAGLFPKRKNEDGSFDSKHLGWYKWSANS